MRNLKFKPDVIDYLLAQEYPLAVSIYMPIHGNSVPQHMSENSSRLNSMLHRVKTRLTAHTQSSVSASMAQLGELVGSVDWWKQRSGRALAFFVEPESVHLVELPLETSENVFIDTAFTVGPILAQLVDDTEYLALILSQNQPRLLQGNRFGLAEVEVANMPGSLTEALNIDEYQEQQQFHSGEGNGRAMFHGQGGGKDNHDADIDRYLRIVRDAIKPEVVARDVPLILLGTDKINASFRNAFPDSRVMTETVEGNYESIQLTEVHNRIWPILEKTLRSERRRHIDRLKQLLATEPKRVILDPAMIRTAALAGKVQTLFLTITTKTKDSIRDSMVSERLERFYKGKRGRSLSTSLVEAWRHRGQIIFANTLPHGTKMAAILRY